VRKKWYQIIRLILPVLYAILLTAGLIVKNMFFMILFMGSALLAGSFYCGWLCPFGALQEWLNKVGRFLKIPQLRIPAAIEKWLRLSRYLLLGLSSLGFAVVLFLVSPYGTFYAVLMNNLRYLTTGIIIFFGLFLLLSLFVNRPFCRYFCPEGARYGAVSLGRLFSICRNDDKCISCGKCDRSCPVQIQVSNKKHVRSSQCINCFECIAHCPVDGALSYRWVIEKKTKARESVENV